MGSRNVCLRPTPIIYPNLDNPNLGLNPNLISTDAQLVHFEVQDGYLGGIRTDIADD